MKVFCWYAVVAPQVSLGLVPEVFNSVYVIMFVSKQFRVVDAVVMELRNIQNIIGSEAISIDD